SYIDQYNGTYLMPSGIVYDAATGTQAPMNTDKYAFYRTTAVNNGLNQYQYGTRSWTNVNGFNETGSNIQNIDEQIQMLRLRTGLLGVSLGAGLVAGSALGLLGSGVALGIFTNFALGALPSFALSYGTGQPAAQVFNQTLIGGAAGVVGAAAGRIVAAPLFRAGQAIGFGATAASALAGAGAGGVAGAIYGGATGYASSGTLRGAIEGAEQLGALGFLGGGLAGGSNSIVGSLRNSMLGAGIGRSALAMPLGGESPSVFRNQFPAHEVSEPIQTFQPSQLAGISRRLNYVVTTDGELMLGRQAREVGGGHIDLVGGRPVLAAGEVKVVGGQIIYIDNASGHYLPSGLSARNAALGAFRANGYNVSDSTYVEKVWDAIRGWIPAK
ncbi:MAG TPA: hypothetical protein VIM11_16260, partial [Tepidisphaeraceae bacterium]